MGLSLAERLYIAYDAKGWPAVYVAADHQRLSQAVKVYGPDCKCPRLSYEMKHECADWIRQVKGSPRMMEQVRSQLEEARSQID